MKLAIDLNFAETFGFDKISVGGMSAIATIGLVLFIAFIIIALVGWLIFWIVRKRWYKYRIYNCLFMIS